MFNSHITPNITISGGAPHVHFSNSWGSKPFGCCNTFCTLFIVYSYILLCPYFKPIGKTKNSYFKAIAKTKQN